MLFPRLRPLPAACALLLAGCSNPADPSEEAAGTGAVHGAITVTVPIRDAAGVQVGTVRYDDLDGIPVYLERNEAVVATAATAAGRFRFDALAPGDYRATAWLIPSAPVATEIVPIDSGTVEFANEIALGDPGGIAVTPNPMIRAADSVTGGITYVLHAAGHVLLTIRSLDMDPVRTLVNELQETGFHALAWDGRTESGQDAPAGIYWVTMKAATEEGGAVLILEDAGEGSGLPEVPPSFLLSWGREGATLGAFLLPDGIALDGRGNVYVVDTLNDRIQVFAENGDFRVAFGSEGLEPGEFLFPVDVALDAAGNLYVVERLGNRVQRFTSEGIYEMGWGESGTGPGQFTQPAQLVVDSLGDVFVTGPSTGRVQRFTSSGEFVRQWRLPDGAGGEAPLPHGIAVAPGGTLYVCDQANHRILEYTRDGELLRTIGGPGVGEGSFLVPRYVALDAAGNLFVAQSRVTSRIQKLAPDGTLLARWGASGTGPGEFREIRDLVVDSSGNVYVVDARNHRVQKFGPGPGA